MQAKAKVRLAVEINSGEATTDGAGVKMIRMIGSRALGPLDPFLMLDYFGSDSAADYIGGFPDHPHRGFETVTYMLAGRMRHRDNHGHEGVIEAGDVQWMTAGRGVVHSEMPEQQSGLMRGFQLWINLPAAQKMSAPNYQEFPAARFPLEQRDGAQVKVVAGRTNLGAVGPVKTSAVDALYLDIALQPGGVFSETVESDHRAFFVVYEGEVEVSAAEGERRVVAPALVVLGDGDAATIKADDSGARVLLIAGRPIGEPIAWGGPFVMNTREEVLQAFDDYHAGRF